MIATTTPTVGYHGNQIWRITTTSTYDNGWGSTTSYDNWDSTVSVTITSSNVRGPWSDLDDAIEDFRKTATSRQALFLAWNKAAREQQFKALLQGSPPSKRQLLSICYGRDRVPPIRERFKKRVCGGHQRYRVMVT